MALARRVHRRGVANSGFLLHAVHENGRKTMESGDASGEHVLLLPWPVYAHAATGRR